MLSIFMYIQWFEHGRLVSLGPTGDVQIAKTREIEL